MAVVYLSIGSNLRNKRKNITLALKYVRKFSKIIKRSFLYKTSPVGYIHQPFFLNCVIKIETDFGPMSLLEQLKLIEKIMGRSKTLRWRERIIDLDILFYENSIIQTEKLVIPHKELHKRKFVLYPLTDVAKNYIHPILKKSVSELKLELKDDSQKIERIHRKIYKNFYGNKY